MNETALTWIVFILAFGGMVVIHEFGHFIVARLCKIEVEEFGIGLPTPGAITFWVSKGHLFLRNGRRIEIPQNFTLPIPWSNLVDRDAKLTVDQINDRFVLCSIEATRIEGGQASPASRKLVKAGNRRGQMEFMDVIAEVHPGTRFTLNWLPLGGFVRPKGENDPNVEGGLAAANPWKRLAVLVAGPFMNLLTAVVVFSIIFNRVGIPDTQRVLVTDVVANSPAAQAGFVSGDIFVTGNGQVIRDYDDLRAIVDANENQPILFVIDRNGKQLELTAIPQMNTESNRVMIGVGLGVPFKQPDSWLQTVQLGVSSTFIGMRTLISLPAQMMRGTLEPEESRLIGLKGIYDIMERSVSHDVGASASAPAASANPMEAPIRTLNLIAVLSISLGIFNLFPFPALDGGRILFVIPEILFRRRVPHKFENLVHGLGMAFLLALMIYVNVMDFINPVTIPMP
jgi:regulator of sigma E protease